MTSSESGVVLSWISPDSPASARRSRGCLITSVIGAIAISLFLIIPLAFLYFYDAQTTSVLAGTIEFETGGTRGCYVRQPTTTFPASATIHLAAHLEREVPAGEKVTWIVTFPNGTSESLDETYDEAGDCIDREIPSGLARGRYVVEFRSGSEVLARGAFDIAP